MKQKIGESTCPDCGFERCDVGLDKHGHPYRVCWSKECAGASQYFSRGAPVRVRSILATLTPLPGVDVAELRAKYKLDAAPAPKHPSAPVGEIVKQEPKKAPSSKTIFAV